MLSSTIRHILTIAFLSVPAVGISAQVAHAEDLVFTLNNNTSSVLSEFYVENMGSKTWGSDILDSDIAPGESATVTIADGKSTCMYGIRGVFKGVKAATEEENLNLCELGSYTYHD